MFGRKLNFRNNHKLFHRSNTKLEKHGSVFLSNAARNTRYVIDNIFAGHGLTQRLLSIGIIPGEIITVGDISAWGPVTIISKGIKIALGRGVASKISLKQISEAGDKA